MKKFNPKGMKFLWFFHILFMVIWMGGILCYLLILLSIKNSGESAIYGAYTSIHAIDIYLIRNGAQGLILTGILYGIFTNWGFFKHRWIAVKWLILVLHIALGAVYLGGHLDSNMKLVKDSTKGILSNLEFIRNQHTLIIGCIIQITFLIFVMLISKFKPWSRKKVVKW